MSENVILIFLLQECKVSFFTEKNKGTSIKKYFQGMVIYKKELYVSHITLCLAFVAEAGFEPTTFRL